MRTEDVYACHFFQMKSTEDKDSTLPDKICGTVGGYVLGKASKCGNLEITKMLIQSGADIHRKVDQIETSDNVKKEVSEPVDLIYILREALKSQNHEQLFLVKKNLCQEFKKHIDSLHRYFLHDTWVGYSSNGLQAESEIENVRIVALYNHKALPICPLPNTFKGISIYWREKDWVSTEGKLTAKQEDIQINIKTKLSKETIKKLFKNHSNLTIVHPSSIKSTCFGTVDGHFEEKPCIALYCHVKGIIPLGEMEFDKKIDGVITDVREGICRLHAGEKLYPGTGITSPTTRMAGTVGAFVEDNSGRTAFLTAAHVVVPSSLWGKKGEERQQYLNSQNISVWENAPMGKHIGNVINWCFFDGTENQNSVDAALVEVNKQNISTENMFPQNDDDDWKSAGYNSDELPKIRTCKLLNSKDVNDKMILDSSILKYGITSRITLGHFVFNGACIKIYSNVKLHCSENKPVEMYGLIGIQGGFSQHFSKPGDSGALCCIVDKQDRTKIYPFGMIVAGCEDTGISYITPLDDVFQKLNLDIVQGIKFYPSRDSPQMRNQNVQAQSNCQVDVPITSTHESTATEQIIKKIQNELKAQKKDNKKKFENMESKLDSLDCKLDQLLNYMPPQPSKTPDENTNEHWHHEEMET